MTLGDHERDLCQRRFWEKYLGRGVAPYHLGGNNG